MYTLSHDSRDATPDVMRHSMGGNQIAATPRRFPAMTTPRASVASVVSPKSGKHAINTNIPHFERVSNGTTLAVNVVSNTELAPSVGAGGRPGSVTSEDYGDTDRSSERVRSCASVFAYICLSLYGVLTERTQCHTILF